jgi:hypothetical protein
MVIEMPKVTDFFSSKDRPYGLSYGEWTTKWWQWAFSTPTSTNPLDDDTGKYSHLNQDGPVWFLCGTFGENKFPKRKCIIPHGKGILFPVINYIFVSDTEFKTEREVIDHVTQDINDIVRVQAIVDDVAVPCYRVKSEPEIFHIDINEENKLGLPGGINKAASDGYWVFLKPLTFGEHSLYFHGSCSGGLRNSTAGYQLSVS